MAEWKWRSGPSSSEGYPREKNLATEDISGEKSDVTPPVIDTKPKESVEEMAARLMREAQTRMEQNQEKMRATQAGLAATYDELMGKADAKVAEDSANLERAKNRLKDL